MIRVLLFAALAVGAAVLPLSRVSAGQPSGGCGDPVLEFRIFSDGRLLTAPVVRGVLRDRAVIAGLSVSEAQALADRINASLASCATS